MLPQNSYIRQQKKKYCSKNISWHLESCRPYYDIRFFEGLLEISKEQETISQANYKLIQRQIELGMKAGADLYEAEAVFTYRQVSRYTRVAIN